VPEALQYRRKRTFVRVTLPPVAEAIDEQVGQPTRLGDASVGSVAVGELCHELSRLMAAPAGSGACASRRSIVSGP
jgi:hypothetical protein